MSRWVVSLCLCALLALLLALTVRVVLSPVPSDAWYGFGGEFIQFYTAGRVVNSGNADRLYDQEYFRSNQRSLVGSKQGQYSLYPPTMALAMSPLARLPYVRALVFWWGLAALCTLAAGWLLYGMMPAEGARRWTMLLALAGMYPCSLAIVSGHLAAVLLFIAVAGFALHRNRRPVLAGCVFSLLAVKPQFAAGILLWLLLRRDLRACCGAAIGLIAQAAAVWLWLGPAILVDYAENLPVIARIIKRTAYAPCFEQSFAGIVANLARSVGIDPQRCGNWFLLTQAAAAGLAMFLVFRVAQSQRELRTSEGDGDCAWRYECASAGLLMLLLPPYLLLYDLLLLAVPIVLLWSSPKWPLGTALYLSATILGSIVYVSIGFSLVPFLALVVLCQLAAAVHPLERGDSSPLWASRGAAR